MGEKGMSGIENWKNIKKKKILYISYIGICTYNYIFIYILYIVLYILHIVIHNYI